MENLEHKTPLRTLHIIGVLSGIAAGAWLGTAEAPVHLVHLQISPFVVSVAMVAGVFVARWTVPTLLKGTKYIFFDIKSLPHLLVWAILAGALWAVANTLTVFAIKDIGLAIAFPIWNSNCVIGLIWGCFLFNELKGAGGKQWMKVGGGISFVILATIILGVISSETAGSKSQAIRGVLAALAAGLLWGTQYIPYRKAYISGMNPLSFVTIFTFGELFTVFLISVLFMGGVGPLKEQITIAKPVLFWFFFGGFCWVLGDLFQQYAAKYIGIGRGIPLSNTNQLWGLAWAILVYNTFAGKGAMTVTFVVIGCLIMIIGAWLISNAEASDSEHTHWANAIIKECDRYNLNQEHVFSAVYGQDPISALDTGHRWWDILILFVAIGIFAFMACHAHVPDLYINYYWLGTIVIAAVALLLITGYLLYKHTRFS